MESAERVDRKIPVYLGGGCSLATEPLATIAGNVYKISTVSYGASSPALSNQELFPNFYRTIPSEIQANSARFALMNKYNWTKIATLYETVSLFSLAANDFDRQYTNIYGRTGDHLILSFSDSPVVALQQIHDKDFRIILGYFYEDKAIATLCAAYHLKLTTPNHVWILPAWYQHNWYDTEYHSIAVENQIKCTKEQMREAVKYTLFLDSYNESDTTTDTGNTHSSKAFVNKLDCYLEEFKKNPLTEHFFTNRTEAHIYSGFTYDAVWMIAFALDRTEQELVQSGSGLTLEDFEYFEANNISRIIGQHLAKTNFSGVSGPVLLDENGTRSGLTGIYQLRENPNNEGELMQMLIAIHHPGLRGPNGLFNFDFNYLSGLEPKWKGGTRNAPSDRSTPLRMHLNAILVYCVYTFASATFVIILAALLFNIGTLRKPQTKYSAPHINTVIIIGCGVMLVGSILLGIDSNSQKTDAIPKNVHFEVLCTLRLWILTLGFTLSFGALFAKVSLVYNIYANTELKDKPFKMRSFFIVMVIFFIIDIGYLSFWTGRYPFTRMLITIEERDQDQTKVLEYENCYCDKFGFLIGSLFAYKGTVAICGLFLAYESRNVKYFYINDSRFVSITMYIVVILVGIGAPLSLVLAVHNFIDAAYGLAAFTIIAACMSCLLILYIPKIYEIVSPTSAEKSLDNPATTVPLSEPETNKTTNDSEGINVCRCQVKSYGEMTATDGKEGISTERVASNSDALLKESSIVASDSGTCESVDKTSDKFHTSPRNS